MNDNQGEAIKHKGLFAKLCEAKLEMGHVAKRGRNDFHKYDYVTEADAIEAVGDKLSSRGIFMFPDVVEEEQRGEMIRILVKWTVIDSDTGESLSFHIPGWGMDKGDKAGYKCLTGSSKYAILKLFQLPTGDDPEKDNPEKGQHKTEGKEARKPNGEEVVILTPYKEGWVALSGSGLPLVRSNLDNKTLADVGFKWEGNVALIPAENAFSFVDLCTRYNVGTTFMNAPTKPVAESVTPKAVIPPFVSPSSGESKSTDPIIISATRRPSKKPGGMGYLAVNWGGKNASCFDKKYFVHIEHHVGRPAVLILQTTSGNYTNVVGIESLEGEPFRDEQA